MFSELANRARISVVGRARTRKFDPKPKGYLIKHVCEKEKRVRYDAILLVGTEK